MPYQVLEFILGYCAVLAVPGPNMAALAGLSASRGFRAALPMSVGIAAGATALAVLINAASSTLARIPWKAPVEFIGATLLLLVAWRVMRIPPNGRDLGAVGSPMPEFGAGFCVSVSNPMTAGYFAAEFSGHLTGSRPETITALLAVPALALMVCLLVCRFLTLPSANRVVRRRHHHIRPGVAIFLIAMSGLLILRSMGVLAQE